MTIEEAMNHLSLILNLALSAALGTTHTVADIDDDNNKVVEFIGNESQMKVYLSKLDLNAGNIVAFGHNAAQLDSENDNSDIRYHVVFIVSSDIVDGKMQPVQMTDEYIAKAIEFKKDNYDYASYVAATVTTDNKVVYAIAHNDDSYDADKVLVQYADGFIATTLLDDKGYALNTLSPTNVVLLVGDIGKRQIVLHTDGKYAKLEAGFDVDFTDGFVLNGAQSGLVQVALGTANLAFASADDLYEFVTQGKTIAWEQIQVMDDNIALIQVSTALGGSLILTGVTDDTNVIGIPVKIDGGKVNFDYAHLIANMPLPATRIAITNNSKLVVMGQQSGTMQQSGKVEFLRHPLDQDTGITGIQGLSTWAQQQSQVRMSA